MRLGDFFGWLQACAAKKAWAQRVLVELDGEFERGEDIATVDYVGLIEKQGRRLYGVRYSSTFGEWRNRRLKAHLIVERRAFDLDKCRCGAELGFMEYFAVSKDLHGRELARALGCSDICLKCLELRDKDDGMKTFVMFETGREIAEGHLIALTNNGRAVPADHGNAIGVAVETTAGPTVRARLF